MPLKPIGPHGARTATPTTSSPKPSRSRSAPRTSCRASISATIRCSPGASIRTSTRRSPGSAARTSTRSRSTPRSRRCTTTSATACTGRRSRAAASRTSRTRSAAAVRSRPGRTGFMSFPQPIEEHKVRGKPEKFAEHYNQATLFWNSQSDVEKPHIVRAFRFELTKVQTVAIRTAHGGAACAMSRRSSRERVADGSGYSSCPSRCRRCSAERRRPEVTASPALSLFARPGSGGHQDAAHRDPRRGRRRRRSSCRGCMTHSPRKARCRVSSASSSARWIARAADADRSRSFAWKPRPRSCGMR